MTCKNKLTYLGCVLVTSLLLVVAFQWDVYMKNDDISNSNRRQLGTSELTSAVAMKPVYIHNLDEDTAKVTCLSPALINLEYKTNREIQRVREKLLSALMTGTVKLVGKDLQKCGTTLERGVRRLEFSAFDVNVITTDAADSPRAPEKKMTPRRLNHNSWVNGTTVTRTNSANSSILFLYPAELNCQVNQTFPHFYTGFEYGTVIYNFTTSLRGYLRVSAQGSYGSAPPYINMTVRSVLTSPPQYESCGLVCLTDNSNVDQTFAMGGALTTPPNALRSTGSTRLKVMKYFFLVTAPKSWTGYIQLRFQCCSDPGCTGAVITSTTTQPRASSTTAKSTTVKSKATATSTSTTKQSLAPTPQPTHKDGSFATRLQFVQASLLVFVITMSVI